MTCKNRFLLATLCLTIFDAVPSLAGAPAGEEMVGKVGASYPAAGRRIDVNFGVTAFRLDFADGHRMSFLGTVGTSKGVTDTVAYTARKIRPGVYMVYWHEPKIGNNVVHIQDFNNGMVYTNIAQPDGQFLHMNGTLHLVPKR